MDETTVQLCRSEECTGCRACFNACRKGALFFTEDSEGFLHPRIAPDSCVHCRACVKACPVLRRPERPERLFGNTVRAAVSTTPGVVAASSSGGLFTELAQEVLKRGGVVYGAAWKSGFDGVEHIGIESETIWTVCGAPSMCKVISAHASPRPQGISGRGAQFCSAGRHARSRVCMGTSEENVKSCTPSISSATAYHRRVYLPTTRHGWKRNTRPRYAPFLSATKNGAGTGTTSKLNLKGGRVRISANGRMTFTCAAFSEIYSSAPRATHARSQERLVFPTSLYRISGDIRQRKPTRTP